jgi:FlaA1/EpsC-like NDP-sugar epimerase
MYCFSDRYKRRVGSYKKTLAPGIILRAFYAQEQVPYVAEACSVLRYTVIVCQNYNIFTFFTPNHIPLTMRFFNRRLAVIAHDLGMVVAAWLMAVAAPYQAQAIHFALPGLFAAQLHSLLLVLIFQSIIFQYYGLYRGLWRFASMPDMWNIVRAAAMGSFAIALGLVLFNRLEGTPRTALILYPLFLVFFLGVPRFLYRFMREHSLRFLFEPKPELRVLIIGAGHSGELLVRDLLRKSPAVMPVAFLDDQTYLWGAKIHGVPVLGSVSTLIDTVKRLEVNLIVIATPSATTAQMQRIVELCEESGVRFRTLPKFQDMVSDEAPRFERTREVSIDDLLGREKVELDWHEIEARLSGKVVMVSGGGGSIGSELCRQIMRLKPASLVIFERCEFNLYQVDMKLRQEFPHVQIFSYLGDVCDAHAIRYVLARYRPQVIFHAAAYKHVPMLQFQTREAARNNVLGTRILAEAAVAADCQAFVLISTDKAVNPGNIMGATKRMAEILCQGMNARHHTRFITVRFGNVLGSAGSVVPLFANQIAQGGPVTVTHPDITRYFMTIPEACQLILQAGAMGKGGEIFVLDMGTPVKILYLAEQMIRLSGKQPGKNIEITFTGLRPGEKLHEELFHPDEETLHKTRHDKIMQAAQRECDWQMLSKSLEDLQEACNAYDEGRIQMLLKYAIPEFELKQVA